MRDVKRIDKFLELVGEIWKDNQDLRFTQLISAIFPDNEDTFYWEETKWEEYLRNRFNK